MKRILLLATSALVAAQSRSTTPSQDRDFIELCGAHLTLGLRQEAVLEDVARQCNVNQVQDSRQWLLLTKEKPFRLFGAVDFTAGRLTRIQRDWSAAAADAVDVAESLYFAGNRLLAEGHTTCVLETSEQGGLGFSIRRLSLKCGRKEIVVSSTRSKEHGDSTDLMETLK